MHLNSELVPALFWFGATDVRKLARQRKCCNVISIYESGAIPVILRTSRTMYTRTSQERPKQSKMLASTARAAGKEKGLTNHPKMLPKSSLRAPKSLPRAHKELPRSSTELPRTSKERPRRPQISQQSPSRCQELSKVRPKGLRGTLWEAFGDDLGLQIEVWEPI